jgi:hypothetical protein
VTADLVFHRTHARRRCRQRFGFKLTRNARGRILADIRTGRARLIRETWAGRELWRVEIAPNASAVVVYSRPLNEIVTVMSTSDRLSLAVANRGPRSTEVCA